MSEKNKTQLVLASASPRRRQMLEDLGVVFSVQVTDTDESRSQGEAPEDLVTRLARDKARTAQAALKQDDVAILAADTIVVQGDTVYGKPSNFQDAQQIWHNLSANKHQVMTAICLFYEGRTNVRLSVTEVEFGRITPEQMERYWATGEPRDKAGAYAIQGYASAWVKLLHGSYSNVVGLPLRELNELLAIIDRNWL